MNKDIIQYMIEKEKITGQNLINLSQVNKYFEKSCEKSIIEALKNEFHITKINKWKPRKLYIRMYYIKKNYSLLVNRFNILSEAEESIHDDRPIYKPEYLYNIQDIIMMYVLFFHPQYQKMRKQMNSMII